jgi:hypothetical protein
MLHAEMLVGVVGDTRALGVIWHVKIKIAKDLSAQDRNGRSNPLAYGRLSRQLNPSRLSV